jgi:hypothetical protein
MDEIDEQVRRLYGEPPEDSHARERARLRLSEGIERDSARPVAETRNGTRWRRALVLAVAALLVAVTATLLALPKASPPAEALDRLAQVAGQTAPPDARSFPAGQMQTFHLQAETHLGLDGSAQTYSLLIRSSITTRVHADGSVERTDVLQDVGFASDSDRDTWVELGRPELPHAGDVHTETLSAKQAAWFNASAVSTDTEQLLANLANGSIAERTPGTDQEFLLIGELLAQPGLTAEQRASLYRAAGQLDGIELLGPTTDPVGRGGDGFAITIGNRRVVIVFDPTTAAPLATEDYTDGQLVGWNAFSTRNTAA